MCFFCRFIAGAEGGWEKRKKKTKQNKTKTNETPREGNKIHAKKIGNIAEGENERGESDGWMDAAVGNCQETTTKKNTLVSRRFLGTSPCFDYRVKIERENQTALLHYLFSKPESRKRAEDGVGGTVEEQSVPASSGQCPGTQECPPVTLSETCWVDKMRKCSEKEKKRKRTRGGPTASPDATGSESRPSAPPDPAPLWPPSVQKRRVDPDGRGAGQNLGRSALLLLVQPLLDAAPSCQHTTERTHFFVKKKTNKRKEKEVTASFTDCHLLVGLASSSNELAQCKTVR